MKPNDHTPATAVSYDPIAVSVESTVVAEYIPDPHEETAYQSEAALEAELIRVLQSQAYEYLPIRSEADLIGNLRTQLELLNGFQFSDAEWDRFFTTCIAGKNDGITEKMVHIHEDNVQLLRRDDDTTKNVLLIDQRRIHNNRLQVINQYEIGQGEGGARYSNRYDVTILVNGLPLVHIELKRRGVDIREAFNQIDRYQRDSFWAGSGLFDYVQLFVISNGTLTKYYSNTTRSQHLKEGQQANRRRKTSNSFEFTSWWADARNQPIRDLIAFAKTFFARHTLLNILTRYCVLTVDKMLLVMRPYQIVAAEKMLQRIEIATNYKKLGTIEAGGYVWHTTGSGKTLTSFKAAQLATQMDSVDKVLFVVDRKDLDYQTMREYDRFQKGAANSNTSTAVLKRQLESRDATIIITTIQKLSTFIKANPSHDVYRQHVVIIFDECHRSQFGDMHTAITKAFKRYNLFGFTGTPIFAVNAASGGNPRLKTTEQAFGEKLHTYTIVDAITDKNVLPFRIDYVSTVQVGSVTDKQVPAIDTERALLAPERLAQVVGYIREHFDQKTRRNSSYTLGQKRVLGFNSLFATASIRAARAYYMEFKRQQERLPSDRRLSVGIAYSYAPNADAPGETLANEAVDPSQLTADDRAFLDEAIRDYNAQFGTAYDTSAQGFEGYYEDISRRLAERTIDLVIVVNMFLTGFDSKTLNTLWVDKSLRTHGLIQAFSRTNRILNSVKTYGNVVCFRDLQEDTDEAIALFGNEAAGGLVLLKPYKDYLEDYLEKIGELRARFEPGQMIASEAEQKEFIRQFGKILRLRNILASFDDFGDDDVIGEAEFQDYRSVYVDLYAEMRRGADVEKEVVNDDLVFEIELVKQVEVGVDYVLMLVEKHREEAGDGEDKEIPVEIRRAVMSSPSLHNKRDLIEEFVHAVSAFGDVDEQWRAFIEQRRREELAAIIRDERLREGPAKALVEAALRDGYVPTEGTAITRILPPTSRFRHSSDDSHDEKKRRVQAALAAYVERFRGLGAAD